MNDPGLTIWKRCLHLSVLLHKITRNLNYPDQFKITANIRRLAIRIPSVLIYGASLQNPESYQTYLKITVSLLNELEIYLKLLQSATGYQTHKIIQCEVSVIRSMICDSLISEN
ncbi:four helix bundle protein [Robertkochia solimangrovi]|uniref:four helix bundle protein n=1 Tax=Robertkochia solimangrovi TaxID=2213046 RepID=UPI00117F4311|nr:four helix bundle protein [Robertkochia solimangrovi]TRZ44955.1 hypothetical protein DMZ48_04110 [Robertkochia solimangrovi]